MTGIRPLETLYVNASIVAILLYIAIASSGRRISHVYHRKRTDVQFKFAGVKFLINQGEPSSLSYYCTHHAS